MTNTIAIVKTAAYFQFILIESYRNINKDDGFCYRNIEIDFTV